MLEEAFGGGDGGLAAEVFADVGRGFALDQGLSRKQGDTLVGDFVGRPGNDLVGQVEAVDGAKEGMGVFRFSTACRLRAGFGWRIRDWRLAMADWNCRLAVTVRFCRLCSL